MKFRQRLMTNWKTQPYLGTSCRANSKSKKLCRVLMSVLLDFRKRRGMTFYRLADSTFLAIQLHRTFDLERRGICCVSRDANEDEPFFIGSDTVVDYLGAGESGVTVKDFLGSGLVGNGPVVHSGVGDHANSGFRDPLPKNDVLVVCVRLDLLLGVDVENL